MRYVCHHVLVAIAAASLGLGAAHTASADLVVAEQVNLTPGYAGDFPRLQGSYTDAGGVPFYNNAQEYDWKDPFLSFTETYDREWVFQINVPTRKRIALHKNEPDSHLYPLSSLSVVNGTAIGATVPYLGSFNGGVGLNQIFEPGSYLYSSAQIVLPPEFQRQQSNSYDYFIESLPVLDQVVSGSGKVVASDDTVFFWNETGVGEWSPDGPPGYFTVIPFTLEAGFGPSVFGGGTREYLDIEVTGDNVRYRVYEGQFDIDHLNDLSDIIGDDALGWRDDLEYDKTNSGGRYTGGIQHYLVIGSTSLDPDLDYSFSYRFSNGTSPVHVGIVPEPALGAMLLGAAGLGCFSRRRGRGR